MPPTVISTEKLCNNFAVEKSFKKQNLIKNNTYKKEKLIDRFLHYTALRSVSVEMTSKNNRSILHKEEQNFVYCHIAQSANAVSRSGVEESPALVLCSKRTRAFAYCQTTKNNKILKKI